MMTLFSPKIAPQAHFGLVKIDVPKNLQGDKATAREADFITRVSQLVKEKTASSNAGDGFEGLDDPKKEQASLEFKRVENEGVWSGIKVVFSNLFKLKTSRTYVETNPDDKQTPIADAVIQGMLPATDLPPNRLGKNNKGVYYFKKPTKAQA